MTSAKFLEWDAWQEGRFEFDGFAPVAMVGGTWPRSMVQGNVVIAVGRRSQGTPCRILEQDVAAQTKIARTATGWSLETFRGVDVLAMPEIGIEVPVDVFYADASFA